LAVDETKRQIQVMGDNGRTRWFPIYCFDLLGREAPTLDSFEVDDNLDQADNMPLEVTVTLSNGQRRWCFFAAPAALHQTGNLIGGTEIPFHFCNQNLIIAGELTSELIGRMLSEIDSQGKLASCTVPIETDSDASDAWVS
jgi:hypothetical protein